MKPIAQARCPRAAGPARDQKSRYLVHGFNDEGPNRREKYFCVE
jgi:hypothetical protein